MQVDQAVFHPAWRGGVLAAIVLILLSISGCGGSSSANSQGSSSSGNTAERRVGRVSVLTSQNDNARSGLNQSETVLTPANVRPSTFGKLAAFPVQGYVYAQPLYVPNVNMGTNGLANLVIVATEHDQLYAFNVDSKQLAWHVDYVANDGVSTLAPDDVAGCDDISPEIGITSTPVIDPASGIVYVVVRTKEVVDGQTTFYQRLHGVNVANGEELVPATIITGPPPDYAATGVATFDPLMNNQRAALLLANNQVYVAWASHCDITPYSGWLISFDKATLQPSAYWTPVPYSVGGGIWMSGGGPAADSNGDIYVPVANGGDHDTIGPQNNFRSSMVRLRWSATGGFNVIDYFAPYNYQLMDDADTDFGSGGVVLLPDQPGPHPHLAVTSDKQGYLYVLDRDNLGKWQPDDNSQTVQTFKAYGNGLATPLFWNSTLFFGGGGDYPRLYAYDQATQQFDPSGQSYLKYLLDSRGSTPSLSANGASNALLWIITDNAHGKPAVLHALDASDISNELYSSAMTIGRDTAGQGVKFVVPTVADGFVFVGAQQEVDMYGLLQ